MDLPMRGQTEKFVKVQQTSMGAMACGFVFLMANSIGIGIWWLWASKETSPTPAEFNVTTVINATVVSGAEAWSQWYHTQGIIVLVVGLLAGLGVLSQMIINCNPHVQKATLYQNQGRSSEAAAEAEEISAIAKMCMCAHSLLSVAQMCLGCIPTIWGCIGLFMFCFGWGFSGFPSPTEGWNDYSKWFIIISLVALGTTCCACCMMVLCTAMGIGAGAAMDGMSEDEEAGDNFLG